MGNELKVTKSRNLFEDGRSQLAHDFVDCGAQITSSEQVFEIEGHGGEVCVHLERRKLSNEKLSCYTDKTATNEMTRSCSTCNGCCKEFVVT